MYLITETPVRCAMDKPYTDHREQRVASRPLEPAPPINLYRATPASISWAKAKAAEERAEVDAAILASLRRHLKAQLREMVLEYGVLEVRTLLEELEGE